MGEYMIAKYIRLSLDDAKTDSMSIENQRLMLDQHITESDLEPSSVLEFVDNGYSGTNFERPAVQELLELIREGKVNCVVVKDFSRFGRNAIETGYFIERVFPLYSVRFISLADGFDSAEHEGDTGGMEVAFKFLMHEYYSRDLSRKIKSAKHERMRRGEHVRKNCVYGYRLDEQRRMVIDPTAAETVRMIFGMYAGGNSLAEIERQLYEKQIPSPSVYKNQKSPNPAKGEFNCVWQKAVILNILRNEQYLGTYVAGKKKSLDVASKEQITVPESDWVKIPGHHPAIIEQAAFEAVRAKLDDKGIPLRNRKTGTNERYKKETASPLNRKMICGHCGHALRISSTKNAAFHCWYSRSAPGVACHGLRLLKSEAEKAVLGMMKEQAKRLLSAGDSVSITEAEQSEFSARIALCQDEKRSLYERFISGEMDAVDYKAAKAKIDLELGRLEQASSQFNAQAETKKSRGHMREMCQEIVRVRTLKQDFVDALIEKVLVYPDGRLEVIWGDARFSAEA